MSGQVWKEAATLMLVGRALGSCMWGSQRASSDYKILFLKRSSRSTFMPKAYVFPGGVVEKTDFSSEWLKLFKNHGHSEEDLKSYFHCPEPRPSFYKNNDTHVLMAEVGFRIGAIRETFEECGLLLAKNCKFESVKSQDHWQKAVHKNDTQFLQMFLELGGCPDIWSLNQWQGWLTPTTFESRRFDTAFYIAFVDSIPTGRADNIEISHMQWIEPRAILRDYMNQKLWLPPPQLYELGRLLNFISFEKLKSFSEDRGRIGMDRWMPVIINSDQHVISVLPGDDLYPEEPDFLGQNKERLRIDMSTEESRTKSRKLHRLEMSGQSPSKLFMNIDPPFGHVRVANLGELILSKL
ncbi:acyl-coenzyme A diphosphatase NUDT19-like isoform X2 [Oratosquilla oratoria]